MATARTRSDGYSGILVPDPRLTPATWSGTTAGSPEAGPNPGQAVPDQVGTQMVVSTSGVQDDTVYRVKSLRGGHSGRAEYAWAPVVSGTTSTYRGCNFPNFAQDLRHVGVSTGTTGRPSVCTTRSGRVVMVWAETIAGTTILYCSYSNDLITWTGHSGSIPIISETPGAGTYVGATLDNAGCACVRWDDDREVVQCFVRVEDPSDTTGGGFYTFYLYESDDEGATWDLVQRDILQETWAADGTCRTPTVGMVAGSLMLLQPNDDGTPTYYVAQWVSSDHGRSFTLLQSAAAGYSQHRLVEHVGKLYLCVKQATTNDVEVATLNSAYDLVSAATYDDVVDPGSAGDVSMCSQHGKLYLFATDTAYFNISVRASDGGGTWDIIGSELLSFEASGNNVDIDLLACTASEGGVALVMRLLDTGTDADLRGRLFTMRCGGWSTITLPPVFSTSTGVGRVSFGTSNSGAGAYWFEPSVTWYPALLPSALTYAATGTGTSAINLTSGDSPRMDVSCLAATQLYYSDHFTTTTLSKGILVYFDCLVSTGGDTTANDSAVRVILSDGVSEYNVTIRMSASAGLVVKDNVGGGVSAVLQANVTARTAYIFALRETAAASEATWGLYSVGYSAWDDYANWTELGTGVVDVDGTPAADSSVEFGVISAASGVTIEQKWYAFHYLAASSIADIHDLAGAWSSDNMLGGAPTSTTPAELRDGLYLAFGGGPSKRGETYLVTPRYDYAKEHVYPHLYPSPRDGYRSLVDSSTVTFQWTFDSDDSPHGFGSSTWGCALIGINFAAVEWEGYTLAGAWETIRSIDSSAEFSSLPYRVPVTSGSVRGPYVTVNTSGSGSASRYIHENEFAGGTLAIGSARFKIIRNTSGTWNVATGKKPCLFLDPDGWDPATATTGTCSIWPPSVVALKHGLGSTEYRRIRLRITGQDTVEGDFRVGQIVIGAVHLFGRKYSWGRTWTMEPGASITELSGGSRTSIASSPSRYTSTFAWSDGHPSRQLYDSSLDPDYTAVTSTASVAHAAATKDDVHTMLEGLVSRIDGPHLPIVWLPQIDYAGSGTTQTITDPHSFLYGRIVSSVSMSMPIGEEDQNEIVQVGEIRIEGEK